MGSEPSKTRAEMIGEALREVGILASVFIPLDYVFSDVPPLSAAWTVVATVVAGFGIFTIGLVIEERRK